MSDAPAPLLRSLDAQQPGLLLVRENDRAALLYAYAQATIDEANYELCVAQQLRRPATKGMTEAELCSSMKPEAIAQRKERRAAIKAASEAIASAVATLRAAREVEKDLGDRTKTVQNENEAPLDPATEAILRREERDRKAKREKIDASIRAARAELREETKTPLPAEPEPLPANP